MYMALMVIEPCSANPALYVICQAHNTLREIHFEGSHSVHFIAMMVQADLYALCEDATLK